MPTTLLHLLLFLSSTLRPLSSTSTAPYRRILHQPFLPLDSSPPPTPTPPSPPKYPFTTSNSTPENPPFFQSYPSPPSPASLATFPANISSLSVPGPSKPNSASSKLIIAAVASVIAAVAVISLAVFLHLRRRTTTHGSGSSSLNESKTLGSDTCSTISFNPGPNTHHIPKLQRPSQTSAEFLYLGTLVNSHAPCTSVTYYNNASYSRKLDSPELRPLPPLIVQQGLLQDSRVNGEVVSSKDDESEMFYSPKGSINGKDSSIGTGSASRRTFAAIEVENFNGSISDSTCTYSSSVPGSGSGSPVRSAALSLSPANNLSPNNSMPRSPDLIEIQTVAPLPSPPEMEMGDSLLEESASPSPPSSSSPERYSRRSEESSPRVSNASDQNVESPVRNSMEIGNLVLPESVSPLPEWYLNKSEESSPRNSNDLDQNEACPVKISSPIRDLPLSSSSSPVRLCEESSPRNSNVSDQNTESASQSPPGSRNLTSERNSNVESPVRISSPSHHNSNDNYDIPTASEMPYSSGSSSPDRYSGEKEELSPNASDQNTVVPEMKDLALLSPEIYSQGSEESSPRISNASDQNVASPVRISSSEEHNSPSQISSSMPETYSSVIEESLSVNLNDSEQNVESPVENGGSVQNTATVIPSPPAIFPVFVPSMQSPVSIIPPPPPPPPLIKAWDSSPKTPTPPAKMPMVPPALKNPLKPIAIESPTLISPIQLPSNDSQTVKNDGHKESPNKETELDSNEDSPPKPKLKPLHWDKVRASSDREMVWDQLKCSSSFELNEEMIETLFVVNTPKPNPKEATRWQVLPSPGQDNGDRILDPKKAQNIAILLKALHVTVDEVCEGLLEGNADILGTELLESLLKMAPTKEEERKLKEYKDDSPVKLGPAERFLKAVVDIPHAFRRVEVMLYISDFESEVEYLKKSFATLEAACEELRTNRMFLKLLEAVLKTGNRMNVGTNRGDAHAFKLDTLLKLVDVKGADGKTTLLHFVVQEIIRSEGARLSGGGGPQESSSITDDSKCRKLGLQVVSPLSSELSNVKKAAAMDAEVISNDVSKLSKGIGNVREVVKLNEEIMSLEESKFSESINSFIEKGEEEICRIQAQENLAMSLVKEITEYFHGDSAKEEAHPFRIFMVVRDFLTSLDHVCKEVGMINERTMVSSAHKFPVPVNPMLQQVSGSDDESLPLNV